VTRARRKHTAAQAADLLERCVNLQHRLSSYWVEINSAATQRFALCLKRMRSTSGSRESAPAIHALWVDCAEQVYARTAHGKGFCKLQADLINTFSAIRLAEVSLPRELQFAPGFSDARRAARGAGGDSEGCSRKHVVWRQDKVTLYRYERIARAAPVKPLLICFALVNRPYVLDLQPDRSFVRRLISAGLDVYLIDWGYADSDDRTLGLHDYIEGYLGSCVRHILDEHGSDSLNLIGVCQGGTFSLCYTALHPGHIRTLTTIATAVDFQTPADLLSKWCRGLDSRLLARAGNAPGELMNALYLGLMPFRLTQHKYVELLERADDAQYLEHFIRMETWVRDCPDQAAAALSQFVKWFYQENRLARGTLRLGRRRVNLAHIVQPVLNIYATRDHIVPADASTPLQRLIGSSDYTAYATDTGHIGIFVSRCANQQVPQRIVEWLRTRNL
jgi:polyhydroxyalkanoate synthase subunit PhaC